jgi:hypothetical protein
VVKKNTTNNEDLLPSLLENMSSYYAIKNENRIGPFNRDELSRLVREGSITGRTLILREDMVEWIAARKMEELADLFEGGPSSWEDDLWDYFEEADSGDEEVIIFRKTADADKTPELCRIAVERDGRNLRYVPEDLRTMELCHIAVEQNGNNLEYVSEDLRTMELCRIAVERDGCNLLYVP